MERQRQKLSLLAILLLLGAAAEAQVRTDGSVGVKQTLSGPNFNIAPSLGRQAGGNLFHSFSNFDLAAGETATFGGANSVQNVLARITGGPSAINGTLRCDIPGANLYLINPSGMVFGPNAALDIKGSFIVTTADFIRLGKGGRFDGAVGKSDVLTTAAPAAFGFLAARPAAVRMFGTQLSVDSGKALSIIAHGDIEMIETSLSAPGGRINLIAAGSKGQIGLRADDLASPVDSSLSAYADISASDAGSLNTAGDSGGAIVVRAGNLKLDNVALNAQTNGALPGQGVDLRVTGDLTLTGTTAIDTSTNGAGKGGNIRIDARSCSADGGGAAAPGLLANVQFGNTTGGGDISVRADTVSLKAGAQIGALTNAQGNAGAIEIDAHLIHLEGPSSGIAGGVALFGQGRGPDIRLHADTVRFLSGARIETLAFGSGAAGSVLIDARDISMSGARKSTASGISAGAAFGTPASIDIRATTLALSAGAQINGTTSGALSGGKITVNAESVSLDGSQTNIYSGPTTGATGNGGDISVHARRISITDGAFIAAATRGDGRGGTLDIQASHLLLIRGDSAAQSTGLIAGSLEDTLGAGGNINIRAGAVQVEGAGIITVETGGAGAGGSIDVIARSLSLDGVGSALLADTQAQTSGGPAGSIHLKLGTLSLTSGAAIVAGTFGSGAGGVATIDAGRIIIRGLPTDNPGDSSTAILAGSLGGSGPGGKLTIRASAIRISRGGAIIVGTNGAGNGGDVSIDARRIVLDHGGILAGSQAGDPTDPPATGSAGSIELHASKVLSLQNHAIISAQADVVDAGNITLQAPRITLANSQFTGASGQTGGNIDITVHTLLYLFNSQINANGTKALGDITIDPLFTILDHSSILTTTDLNAGGNINIRTDRLFESLDSRITAAKGATVTLTIFTPDANISGSLVPVNAPLFDSSMTFAEQCSRRLEQSLSSFLITGRGALPLQPGGLMPSLEKTRMEDGR